MNNQQFYTLLYDMALATSGETQVRPLLTKTLQRLLYHTGFPCGLFIRPLDPEVDSDTPTIDCCLELRICHDKSLPEQGEIITVDRNLLYGPIEQIDAHNILGCGDYYQDALRIPVRGDGAFLLLSPREMSRQLPYRQLFDPIMGNFSKNLHLCRSNEASTQKLQQEIEQHTQTLTTLRESERNHKEAQRIGKIGHWILQTETGNLSWSDEVYRIFGRHADFKPGLKEFYETVHPDDLDSVKEAVNNSSKKGYYRIEHRIILPDNSIRWVCEQARIIRDDDGEVIQMVGTVQDITDQRQAAEEKEFLMRQLQHSQKMESLGHLTGGIAHDFNNILAAMLGFAELLQEMIPLEEDKDKLLGYVNEIVTGGERARDLVAQMLAFSRGQSSNKQDINPIPVIKDAVKLLHAMIPSSISISTVYDLQDDIISIDPVQLHQLVMNLVINARDAMDGHGEIQIGARSCNLQGMCNSCRESFSGEFLELYVKDTGTGIEKDILNRIFDPFYTSKDVGKGTGMGLSVVHGIVHDSNGHILIETTKNSGTIVSLLFPHQGSSANGRSIPEPGYVSKA